MLSDEELGFLLARELHEIAADLAPSESLREQVDALTSRPRLVPGRLTRMAALVASSAVALVVSVAILSGGSNLQPAFAVTLTARGQVRVTIRRLTALKAANAKLRELGLPVVVAEIRPGCQSRVGRADIRHTVSTVATSNGPARDSADGPRKSAHPRTVVLTGGVVGRGRIVLVARGAQRDARSPICVSPAAVGLGRSDPVGLHANSRG
jgi:hypothetical protein